MQMRATNEAQRMTNEVRTTTMSQVLCYFMNMDKCNTFDRTVLLDLLRDLKDEDYNALLTNDWRFYLKMLNVANGTKHTGLNS